jgi:3-oxoacyl-[acyl-carrier protein] reductase
MEESMDLQLKGKSALVTGASRGLGFATALCLAQEGVRVMINARQAVPLEQARQSIAKETGASVFALAGDLQDSAFPAALVQESIKALGGLDLLFVNAGGPASGLFETLDDATWQKSVDLTLMSAVRLIRAALPALKQSSAASVVTMTSYSIKQPIPNLLLSNSLRAAVIGLTKSLSFELADTGIRFNSILPGWTETERVQEIMAFRAKQNQTSIAEEMQKIIKDIPLGRMAQPQEFARAAVFLASPAASYIQGTTLTVDGGITKSTF